MKSVLSFIAIISLAHAYIMSDGYIDDDMFGVDDQNMYRKQIIGTRQGPLLSGFSSGLLNSRLCKSYCGNEMSQTSGQMDSDMIEETLEREMMSLMDEMRRTMPEISSIDQMESRAEQMAKRIMVLSEQGEETQMQRIMKRLMVERQSKLSGSGAIMVENKAKQEAMEMLKELMILMTSQRNTMKPLSLDKQTVLMEDTLKIAIMAQMTMKKMLRQKSMNMPIAFNERMMENFFIQLQMVLQEFKLLKAQAAFKYIQIQFVETQVQLRFLNNQIQMEQMLETILDDQEQTVREAHLRMLRQQEELMARQLAEQMVMRELEQMMLSQQKIMQKLTERQVELSMRNPGMNMSSMRFMPKTMRA